MKPLEPPKQGRLSEAAYNQMIRQSDLNQFDAEKENNTFDLRFKHWLVENDRLGNYAQCMRSNVFNCEGNSIENNVENKLLSSIANKR